MTEFTEGNYSESFDKLSDLTKKCLVDKDKIADYFLLLTLTGVKYEMEQFQTTQAEIKLNKKKIKFYKTLTDQYENAKSKKMEAEFMDDDFQIDTKKNYFNLIKKSLEWYRLHGQFLKSTMYGFN